MASYILCLIYYIKLKYIFKQKLYMMGNDPNPSELDYPFHKMGKYSDQYLFPKYRQKCTDFLCKRNTLLKSIDLKQAKTFIRLENVLVVLIYSAGIVFVISLFIKVLVTKI